MEGRRKKKTIFMKQNMCRNISRVGTVGSRQHRSSRQKIYWSGYICEATLPCPPIQKTAAFLRRGMHSLFPCFRSHLRRYCKRCMPLSIANAELRNFVIIPCLEQYLNSGLCLVATTKGQGMSDSVLASTSCWPRYPLFEGGFLHALM